ncbi:uncharacterized protein [Panulirus ornatus]|uniref:uncharacterized protein isoform X4 n=1 Tax=Panulirus ornatus TaxID=150431 RepID=UPI003A853C96
MAGITAWILLSCLSVVAAALNTVLNVEEINSIHYAVDILSKPVLKDQVWDGEVMTVVNKHGQEYICSLPSVTPLDSDLKHDEDILDQLVDISVLLRPMETAPCLIKTVDWWTYEFCYGSVIKQYHLEDSKASGPIIILGKYESEYNWKNSSETKNRLQRFHSQFYVNGTKCDLTGEPRRTEVRFHCEDGVGDYIQRVDEPESCRYVVTVATTRVCHHPYLRLQSVRTPHAITCAPALTQEQYHRYLTYQDRTDEAARSREDTEDVDDDVTGGTTEQGENRRKDKNILDVGSEDDESLITDMQAKELLQFLDVSEDYTDSTDVTSTDEESMNVGQESEGSYLTEEDELDDDEDEVEEKEAMRQTSKSTKRDHFSKLQRRLRQLGKMFMNQETDGVREGEEDKIAELQKMVDTIKDGHIKQLEQEVKEWTNKLLSKDMLLEMDEEDLEEEEQRLGSALSSLMDALSAAENTLSTAKKEMETLEEFLDSQLKEMEDSASQEGGSSAPEKSSQQDRVTTDSQDLIEGMAQVLEDPEEDTSSKNKKNADKGARSTRKLQIMKNRMEDEFQKTKIEQTIKDRLQKLGLENIGRKFELKILTPNFLEDEDTNNPLLSQEETEAFQNMIVDLLSANAEELEEKENHRKLEKNYSFKWDDSQLAEDEDE